MASKATKKRADAASAAPPAAAKPVQSSIGSGVRNQKTDPGSKQSRVIAMLQSPAGATIVAMMKATGWQQHSVRGFLAGVVRKRLKLKLGSKKVDDQRVYQITSSSSGKCEQRSSKRRPS